MSEPFESTRLSEASPSVQTHLAIMQGVIERMAGNSTSAKAWCITIVSAILVVVADNSNPDHALLAMIPTFLFAALDAYYLAMERGFRNAYCRFVEKVHDGIVKPHDLYFVRPHGRTNTLQWEALRSFSAWGFYVVLAVLILAARSFVLT